MWTRIRRWALVIPVAAATLAAFSTPAHASSTAVNTASGFDGAMVEGFDNSNNNEGTIDFAAAAQQFGFAIMKASESTDFVDAYFTERFQAAKGEMSVIGAYHFFDPRADGVAQAEHNLAVLADAGYDVSDTDTLPIMVDVEPNYVEPGVGFCFDTDAATMNQRLSDYVEHITTATGQAPMVYTNGEMVNDCGLDTAPLTDQPLVVPAWNQWGADPLDTARALGWDDWTFWQYDSYITVPGGVGALADRFNGDADALADLAAGTQAPTDAPATVGKTDGDGLTVRQAPNTGSAALDLVHTGDRVDIACQAYGEPVTNTMGFDSDLWDYSTALGGYLADAYMDTGYDYRIPGVPECEDEPPGDGEIVALQQNQGQVTQWEDCGPTSVVTALLAQGVTPHGWDPSYPVESIHRAREDMGLVRDVPTGGTNEAQVNTAFSTYGLSTYTSGDFQEILAHVRGGGSTVLAGNTIDLPWPVNVASPDGVPHFLTVAGYDADSGEYLVVDPIAVDNTVKSASEATLAAYFDHDLGRAGVLV